MKKQLFFNFALIIILVSCSSYSIKTEMEDSSRLDSFKKTGIIFRIPSNNEIEIEEYQKGAEFWLNSYTKTNKISIIKTINPNLNVVKSEFDRFYQVSSNNDFLKFKSTGIITIYLRNYAAELKEIIEKNGLDSLFILESNTLYSTEMQFCNYDSVLVGIDKNLKLVYMDHQKDSYDFSELDTTRIKKDLLDKVITRLMKKLESFDYIDQ